MWAVRRLNSPPTTPSHPHKWQGILKGRNDELGPEESREEGQVAAKVSSQETLVGLEAACKGGVSCVRRGVGQISGSRSWESSPAEMFARVPSPDGLSADCRLRSDSHLVNLNEDPLMSECLLYHIKDACHQVAFALGLWAAPLLRQKHSCRGTCLS